MTALPPSSVLTLSAYRRRTAKATAGLVCRQPQEFAVMSVDGWLQRQVGQLVYVPFYARRPSNLADANSALQTALMDCTVWLLLHGYDYPAWVVGTLLQRQQHDKARIFLVYEAPHPHFQEFLT